MKPNFVALLNEKIISLHTVLFHSLFGGEYGEKKEVYTIGVYMLVLSASECDSWKNLKHVGWLQKTTEAYTVRIDPPVSYLEATFFFFFFAVPLEKVVFSFVQLFFILGNA